MSEKKEFDLNKNENVPSGGEMPSDELQCVSNTDMVSSPVVVTPPEEPPPGPKTWSVGTLTYTFSGIVAIFVLLLVGDFIWSLRERSVGMIARILFKQFGAPDWLNGVIVVSIPTAIGMLLGPVISYRSDRYRSRWGRRIPFLLITTPIVVAGMLGMAFSPMIGEYLGEHVFGAKNSILLTLAVFWVIFEFGAIAGNAIFSALINDVVPHEFLGRFYGLFRIMSLAAGIIFNYWFLGKCEEHYMWLFIGLGAIYGVGFMLMCLKVREGDYPPPPMPREGEGGFIPAVKTYFRESYSNSYYLLLFLFFMSANFAFAAINTYCIFYSKQLNVSLDTYGKFIAYSYMISFVVAYFLGWLADRFHPLRCGLITMAVYGVSMLLSGYIIDGEFTFGIAVVVHCVVSGAYFTLAASLPLRLYPRSRFAQFASAGGLIASVGSMVVVPLMGAFVNWHGDYRWLFYLNAILSFVTVAIGLVVYKRFNQFGGVRSYVAPE